MTFYDPDAAPYADLWQELLAEEPFVVPAPSDLIEARSESGHFYGAWNAGSGGGRSSPSSLSQIKHASAMAPNDDLAKTVSLTITPRQAETLWGHEVDTLDSYSPPGKIAFAAELQRAFPAGNFRKPAKITLTGPALDYARAGHGPFGNSADITADWGEHALSRGLLKQLQKVRTAKAVAPVIKGTGIGAMPARAALLRDLWNAPRKMAGHKVDGDWHVEPVYVNGEQRWQGYATSYRMDSTGEALGVRKEVEIDVPWGNNPRLSASHVVSRIRDAWRDTDTPLPDVWTPPK